MTEMTCRTNFDSECEILINKQINMELNAFYFYLNLSSLFNNEKISLKNISNFFKKQSTEELGHAQKWIDYLNQRGGVVQLYVINKPIDIQAKYFTESFETSLKLEKEIHNNLLKLHKFASSKQDEHLCDFIESEFLTEQVKSQREFMDFIVNAKRCDSNLGIYLFDKNMNKN